MNNSLEDLEIEDFEDTDFVDIKRRQADDKHLQLPEEKYSIALNSSNEEQSSDNEDDFANPPTYYPLFLCMEWIYDTIATYAWGFKQWWSELKLWLFEENEDGIAVDLDLRKKRDRSYSLADLDNLNPRYRHRRNLVSDHEDVYLLPHDIDARILNAISN